MTAPLTGYVLERVYSTRLLFEGLPTSTEMPEGAGTGTPITVAWDWRMLEQTTFEVLLTVSISPTRERPEKAEATLVGRFHMQGDRQSLDLSQFAATGATSTLFAYAREAIGNLTGRGMLGPVYLDPVNIVELMKNFDMAAATGAKQLGSQLAALTFPGLSSTPTRLGSPKDGKVDEAEEK